MSSRTPPRRFTGRWPLALPGGLLAGVLALPFALAVPAVAAAAPTVPRPAPGQVPGVATNGSGVTAPRTDVFYRQVDDRLTLVSTSPTGEFLLPATDLGGELTSGPAAVIRQPPVEFTDEFVFARGSDDAVWYRSFSDGLGEWLPWTSLGGRALGAPSVTCTSPTSPLAVFTQGTDNALWRRALGGAWASLGGRLASAPAAVPAVAGQCPSQEDVFALGTDQGVWEHLAGSWRAVGGRSMSAPTAVRLSSGETDLIVRGTDNAVWMNTRAPGGTTWAGWLRLGGTITSAPAANIFPSAPQTRVIFAVGADGNLWRCRNAVGTTSCTWSPVP